MSALSRGSPKGDGPFTAQISPVPDYVMSVPYTFELNDKPAFEKKMRTAEEFDTMIRRQFDVLWREGETQARVMAVALHPYLIGVPHRIGVLDSALGYVCGHEGVWLTTGSEIASAGREALAG